MPARRALALACALAVCAAVMSTLPSPASAATTTQVTQRYSITATLNVATGRLDGVEVLTLTNRSAFAIDHVNLSVIPRALGYWSFVGAITVDGDPVPGAWTTTTNLRLGLEPSLAPNDTAVIRIGFRLNIGRSLGSFSARLSRENGVISFGEWFPILSRVHDSYGVGDPQVSYNAQLIRLDLTTTSTLGRNAVACPGLKTAPASSGTHWVCETANVRDFSFVVNPNFRLTTRSVGATTIRVYTQTVTGAVTADKARAALIGLNQAYGTYPWPDLMIAEVGAGGGFSMEYPRSIHLTRGKVTDTYVIDHEVAHQWFYGQLGNDQMLEPWLDEGFADFSARHVMGIGENQCSSRDVDSTVFAWPAGLTSGGDWTSCNGYFHAVFYKGTEFLNAVRGRMGSADFFAAMRAFLADHRYEVTTTRALLDHLEGWDAASLLPLYRQYLWHYDPPVVRSRLPNAGDDYALPTTAVSVVFNRPMRNINTTNFLLRDTGSTVNIPATVTYDAAERRAVLRPASPLRWGRSYTAILGSSIRDAYGNHLSGQSWAFRTPSGATFQPPRAVALDAGPHTGYRFTSSGDVYATRTATLPHDSGAPASMRAYINGRWHLLITSGTWASYWLRESSRVHLDLSARVPGRGPLAV